MEHLTNWLFTFNSHTGNWRACTRDQYLDFFSKPESDFVRSKNIEDLRDLIVKNQGDADKLTSL